MKLDIPPRGAAEVRMKLAKRRRSIQVNETGRRSGKSNLIFNLSCHPVSRRHSSLDAQRIHD
jgi:hypothetical protein